MTETRQQTDSAQQGHAAAAPAPNDSALALLWRRKWVIVACVALALGAAAVYLRLVPSRYRSQALLHVGRRAEEVLDGAAPASHPSNFLPTQCELMKSSLILRAALDKPGIADSRTLTGGEADPIERLKEVLSVDLGRRHDIISTSVVSEHPAEAARIANAVVEAYIEHQRAESSQTLETLREQRAKAQAELDDKVRQMVDFQLAHDQGFENEQDDVALRRLAQLSESLTRAELELVDARYHWDTARQAADEPARLQELVTAAQNGVTMHEAARSYRTEQELLRAQNTLDSMRKHYSPDHPALISAKEEVRRIRGELEKIRDEQCQAFIVAARDRYEVAQRKLNAVQDRFEQQQQRAMQINTLGAQFALLKTDAERTGAHLDVLDARLKQLDLAGPGNGLIRYEVLEEAHPSDKPVSPNARKVITLALLAGVILGCGLAVMLDWSDSRFRSAAEVSKEIRHPVLGAVPRIPGPSSPEIMGQKVRMDPTGPVAEAMRIIATSVYFGTNRGQYKSLLVTSAAAGEGKSTIATNLAITLADSGKRVLLIDADMHRPMQHLSLRVSPEPSPSAKEGQIPPLEQLLVRSTQIRGLDLLPGGALLGAAIDVLGDKAFEYLLERLGKKYDRIVIDAPPLLPVAEGRALAAVTDGVLLVVRSDRGDRESTQAAHRTLHDVNANFLGLVLNRSKASGRYGYKQKPARRVTHRAKRRSFRYHHNVPVS
jgi:capsular exopolysaccharide synthesis family protein